MCFYGVIHAPTPRRRGPSVPKFFWTPKYAPNGLTYSDEMWCANTCWSSVFLWVSHAPIPKGRGPSVPKILWDPLLTPKWFAGKSSTLTTVPWLLRYSNCYTNVTKVWMWQNIGLQQCTMASSDFSF